MQYVQNNVMAIITLIVGVAIGTIVIIFAGTLGASTYATAEADIEAIGITVVSGESFTASNTTYVQLNNYPIISGTYTILNESGNDNTSDFTLATANGSLITTDNNINGTTCSISYTHGTKTIQNHIKSGIVNGFKALSQTGGYMPLIVLGVVIFLVLSMILGLGFFTGMDYSGGKNAL